MTGAAFQFNPSLQPRAFVVLGCLAKEEIDDDLLFQILVALIRALSAMDEDDCDLIVSIVMFLTNIVENLPTDSIYLQPMFWVAMSLLQLSHVKIFYSALNLLHVVLTTLYNKGFFSSESMASFLLKGRELMDEVALALDIAAGIHFKEDFPLAVTATVLKGLKHPSTKAATFSVLMLFLEISCKCSPTTRVQSPTIQVSNLYYLLPLLVTSTETEQQKNLLWMVGFHNVELNEAQNVFKYHGIFEKIDMSDRGNDIFWVALIVTMLHSAEYEAEYLVLFRFLAEVAISIPDVLLGL
jgi:neurofibromin 1